MCSYYVLITSATGGKISCEVIECELSDDHPEDNLGRIRLAVKRRLMEYPIQIYVACLLCKNKSEAYTLCEVLKTFDIFAAEFTPALESFLASVRKDLERITSYDC